MSSDRSTRWFAWLSAFVVAAVLLAATPGRAESLEVRAQSLEAKLMAPCCGGGTVRNHESGATARMRQEIRQMLAAGRNEQEILDHYVAEHGTSVLAAPPPVGFNLLAYVFAPLFMLGGAVLLFVMLRRWRSRPVLSDGTASPAPPVDPVYLERLQRELRERG